MPRGFQEVKVPRLRDNGPGWWQGDLIHWNMKIETYIKFKALKFQLFLCSKLFF